MDNGYVKASLASTQPHVQAINDHLTQSDTEKKPADHDKVMAHLNSIVDAVHGAAAHIISTVADEKAKAADEVAKAKAAAEKDVIEPAKNAAEQAVAEVKKIVPALSAPARALVAPSTAKPWYFWPTVGGAVLAAAALLTLVIDKIKGIL